MGTNETITNEVRAALAPHGLFLRGVVHFDGDGPELASGDRAGTVMLIGNIGGSLWPAFDEWRKLHEGLSDPLDHWSLEIIAPIAARLGAEAYFPSQKPWQPFQQWAMRAEGLKASPLGILIHPDFGLWHGYRGALGFAGRVGEATAQAPSHPCDGCLEKPCLTACPVDAIHDAHFDVASCRSYLKTPEGHSGCLRAGCVARNLCPVGSHYRYPSPQLSFHMAALG